MVFQDPMTSLDPVYRIGNQIAETVRQHDKSLSRKAADGPGGRPAQAGRHPERGGAGRLLPARVLRRHAAARGHRHRDRQPARGDHRRRADHGAGRDRPGAGARGAEERAGRDRGGDGPDHPRPRRGRRDGRPGPGHVRRPRGREGHRRGRLLPPPDAVLDRPARLHAAHRRRRPAAAHPDQGRPAVDDQPAGRAARSGPRCPLHYAQCDEAEPDLLRGRRRATTPRPASASDELVETEVAPEDIFTADSSDATLAAAAAIGESARETAGDDRVQLRRGPSRTTQLDQPPVASRRTPHERVRLPDHPAARCRRRAGADRTRPGEALPDQGRASSAGRSGRSRPSTGSTSTSTRGRRSGWSASPAAASRPPAGRSCTCSRRPAGR